jgi:hypothetical protein
MESTYQDDLEQHFLVHLHELLVPLVDIRSLLAGVRVIFVGGRWVILVMSAPVNDFLEDKLGDLGYVQ